MHTQPKFEDSTSNLTDEELKSKILQLTREYSQRRHHNSGVGATKKNFLEGVSQIDYAARVFDEEEVAAAVNATLDFWLTRS